MTTWKFGRAHPKKKPGENWRRIQKMGEGVRAEVHTNLGEFPVREVFEQRTFSHGAVADQDEPKLIIEHGVHHG